MKSSIPLALAGGAAAYFLLKPKKKPPRPDPDPTPPIENILTEPDFNEVIFSSDLSEYKIGGGYRIRTLDKWLNERRLDGKLATVDHDKGWLYSTFVDDPTTWIGEITGTGKVGGSIVYAGLWIMATVGVGIYASGLAGTGSNLLAASRAAPNIGLIKEILGPRALEATHRLASLGFSDSRIYAGLLNFGGVQSLEKWGVGKAMAALSAGAAGSGLHLAAGTLIELGIDSAYAPDLAASAFEAAAAFTLDHNVTVDAVDVPIALLPASYESVQEFNKWIMAYIIRFQKMTFED